MLRPVLMLSMRPGPCSHPSRCSFFVPFDDVSLGGRKKKSIRPKIVPPDAATVRSSRQFGKESGSRVESAMV